jgi:hypothetical protein
MHDVFVSHASPDAARAAGLVRSLEDRGVRCWVAPRDVPPGSDYGEAIVGAIRGSRIMIVLVSQAAIDSAHVKREVERAVAVGVPTLPVRIEDATPSGALEYFLSGSHSVDWLSGPPATAASHIERALRTEPEPTDLPVRPAPAGGGSRTRLRTAAAAAAGLVVLAVVILLLVRPDGDTPSGTTQGPVGASGTETPTTTLSAVATGGPTTTSPTTAPTTTSPTTAPTTTIIPGTLLAAAAGWSIQLAENYEDNAREWFVGTLDNLTGEQIYRFNRGRYVMEVVGNADRGSFYSTIDLLVGSSLEATVSVTPVDVSADAACGLVVRTVDDRELFVAVAAATGRGGVSLFVDRQINQLMADQMPLVESGADEVRLILDGTVGYVVVNDVAVGSFEDDRLGDVIAVGVGAQFGESITCRFDDLVVRAP